MCLYEKSLFNVNAFHNKCFNFLKLFLYFFLFKVEKYFQNYVLCLFYIFVLFFQFESIAFNLNNFIFILIFPESHVFKNNRSKSFFFFIYFYIFIFLINIKIVIILIDCYKTDIWRKIV